MQVQKAKAGCKILKLNDYSVIKGAEYPGSWHFIRLGDHHSGELTTGVNKDKEDYGKGCCYVTIIDIFRDFTIDPEKLRRVNVSNDEIEKYRLEKGDLVLDRSSNVFGTAGYPCYFDSADEPVVYSGFTFRFRPKKETWDSKFLTYQLMSQPVRKLVNSISTKSANVNVNQNAYKKIKIPCPPIPEQQKITSILSNVDSCIQQYDSIIESTKRFKTGLMQKLLTKGIGHTKFKKVKSYFRTYEEIPNGWPYDTIKSLTLRVTYGLTVRPKYIQGGIPLISAREISSGIIDYDSAPKISKIDYEKLSKKSRGKSGDILYSKTGTIGFVGRAKTDQIFAITQNVASLRPIKTKILPRFLECSLKTKSFFKKCLRTLNATTILDLQLGELRKIKIPIPSIPEQEKITSILSNTDSQISELESKKYRLESLKKGLMQKLLTGELRVRV